MTIEAALEAAQRADWPSALRAAVAAWRAEPDARLAALVVQLGPRAARSITPLGGERWTERNKAWFAAAKRRDAVELHYVLEAAGDVRGDAELIARLQKLEKIEDPRIAIALRAIARDKRSWYAAGRYIEERLAILDAADATRRRTARAIVVVDDDGVTASVVDGTAATGAGDGDATSDATSDSRSDATSDATIEALVAACDRAAVEADDAADEAALLAAIYAAPDDDGPRLVYADWLQARNDPRGELIALQTLPRDRTGNSGERERGLVAQYGEKWKGPLAPYIAPWGLAFVRGFVGGCRVEPVGPDRRRPPEHPAWATVSTTHGMLPPLASARGLKLAHDLDPRELMYLATFPDPPPITGLGLGTWRGDFDPRAGTWDAASREASVALAAAQPRLPALRVLELTGSNGWIAGDGMSPTQLIWPWRELGVTTLVVRTAFGQLAAWIEAARDSVLDRLELQTFGEYGHRYDAWQAVLRRGDDGSLSALQITCGSTMSIAAARAETSVFAAGLALVPPDTLTKISVQLPKRGLLDGSVELAMCLAAIARQRRLVERSVTHRGKG